MPLHSYGVLKGRVINSRPGSGRNPHYQMHLIDDATDYRISINVKSKLSPSELFYIADEHFEHSITQYLVDFERGFTAINSVPGGVALDFIRGNLFDPSKMTPLPHDISGPDNDLNDKINHFVKRAIGDSDSMIYAFGERFGPEQNTKDKYFGFKPGNGIHDIHMNQGNVGKFVNDDGVWQDGGLLFHFPEQNQWIGIFLAFQSQAWHTDDRTGHTITINDEIEDGSVRIIAAKVNPAGNDVSKETVILLNASPEAIDLDGWMIADKNKKKERLSGTLLRAGETITITLSGESAQLSNKGGIISLLNKKDIKVDGVSYTKAQAKKHSWTLVF